MSVVKMPDAAQPSPPTPLPKRERGDLWCTWIVTHLHEVQ